MKTQATASIKADGRHCDPDCPYLWGAAHWQWCDLYHPTDKKWLRFRDGRTLRCGKCMKRNRTR